ncbi:NimA [Deinococcus arenae]|uniref:NimA n=1 Tax=Deinococcus arenae TaxID=1452751 RepID=A0A8H9GMT7_9DEIO|nr:pyridoxamine 5'-phosphate oxidase family protein [Deinococcus arenae]AWT35702.1 pyridoxamine 5'-phosphate oxidase family protein [Deinococcus actinosclerus]GGM32583.1 NimA [Deinococcus arenae]
MTGFYDPAQRDPSLSRRPQNRRDDAWIEALLLRVPLGRVATVYRSEDGRVWPFVTPLAFAYRPGSRDLVYHTNVVGRLRANTEQAESEGHPATFEVTETGALLPSTSPLELSVQYRSVIVFGTARVLRGEDARAALTTLSERVFPGLRVGTHTRPISDADLARTAVYALSIERWSGKENWADGAAQEDGWPALPAHLAAPFLPGSRA